MYVPSAGYCLAVVVAMSTDPTAWCTLVPTIACDQVLHAFLQGTLHKPRAPPRWLLMPLML